jgi:hypothetical protein
MRLLKVALVISVLVGSVLLAAIPVALNRTSFRGLRFVVKDTDTGDYNNAPTLANYTYYYVTEGNTPVGPLEVTTLAATDSAYSAGGAKTYGSGGMLVFHVPNAVLRSGNHHVNSVWLVDANGGDEILAQDIALGMPVDVNTVKGSAPVASTDLTTLMKAVVDANLKAATDGIADLQTRVPASLTAEGRMDSEDPNAGANNALLTHGTYGLNALLTAINSVGGAVPDVNTTVASATSKNTFVVAGGTAASGAHLYQVLSITDATDSHTESRVITGWTSGLEVTVYPDLSFTPTAGDVVIVRSYAVSAPGVPYTWRKD